MNIFIIGLPGAGKSTLAKSLAQEKNCIHIDGSSWLQVSFREKLPHESDQKYQEEYHQYFINRLKLNPNLCSDNILQSIKSYNTHNFIIEGIINPKDFVQLFNYNNDIVVFLNRIDNTDDNKDYENIAVSVMRDYCFWLASADLLSKKNWLEFNFKFSDKDSNYIKTLGSKNTVIIVKTLNNVLKYLKDYLIF